MSKLAIHNPHDTLFKAAIKHKQVAIDLLRQNLSEEWRGKINFATLKLENSSFVSEEMSQSHSDVVYSATIDDRKGYVYLLIEAQSTIDKYMALRLWEYNTKIMRQHMQQYDTAVLPCIVNLVMYNGKARYEGPMSLWDAFENPEYFVQSLKSPFLVDMGAKGEDEVMKSGDAALLELVMKHARHRDFCRLFEREQMSILYGVLIGRSVYGTQAMLYIFDIDDRRPEDILGKLTKLDPSKKQEIMSGLERMMQKSRKEGMQRGMERAISRVSKKFNISIKEAEKIIKGK